MQHQFADAARISGHTPYQVTELSAAEQAKLRDKLKPVVDKHGAAIAATVAEMQAELAKLRK